MRGTLASSSAKLAYDAILDVLLLMLGMGASGCMLMRRRSAVPWSAPAV